LYVCSFFEVSFIGMGYLMLFDPEKYVDLWNRHSQGAWHTKRLTVEKCCRIDHRAVGLFFILFGIVRLYLEVKILSQ